MLMQLKLISISWYSQEWRSYIYSYFIFYLCGGGSYVPNVCKCQQELEDGAEFLGDQEWSCGEKLPAIHGETQTWSFYNSH